jgi:hypothetical protein
MVMVFFVSEKITRKSLIRNRGHGPDFDDAWGRADRRNVDPAVPA